MKKLVISVIVVVIAAGGWVFYRSQTNLQSVRDLPGVTLLEQAHPIEQPFKLQDHQGRSFTQDSLKNHWSLVFFGYTHCPDICPATMFILKQVANKMDNKKIRFVFVSVDPDRDKPEVLKKYIEFYGPPFLGVTGDVEQIDALTQQVFVEYEIDRSQGGEEYTVNHSASLILLDPQGRMRASLLAPHEPDNINRALNEIMEYYDT